MKRQDIPGGWYVEALPSGEFACVRLGMKDVLTHAGPIPVPLIGPVPQTPLQPLYVRITNLGGFRFAGQSSNTKETLTWAPGFSWTRMSVVPCGVSPVIYDHAGELHISNCSVGSQGYRYVDYATGEIVSGDATYTSPFGLSEWSYLGDGLYVGQGSVDGGTLLWDAVAGVHRLVAGGRNRNIRVQRQGDNVALAWWVENNQPSVIVWTTMQELRALPVYVPSAPPQPEPGPEPPQPQPPDPTPEPPQPQPIPPTPNPQPPQEAPVKIDRQIVPLLTTPQDVTEVPHPDGQGLVALKTSDGKYLSLTPNGSWQADSGSAGAWERFLPNGSTYIAYREDTGKYFAIFRLTVKVPYAS